MRNSHLRRNTKKEIAISGGVSLMRGDRIVDELLLEDIFRSFDEFRRKYPINGFPDVDWGVVEGDTSFSLERDSHTGEVWLTNSNRTRRVRLLSIQEDVS